MNKYYVIAAIAIIGILLVEFGIWAKITHQSYALPVLTAGLILRAIGLVGLVWLLIIFLKAKNKV